MRFGLLRRVAIATLAFSIARAIATVAPGGYGLSQTEIASGASARTGSLGDRFNIQRV